AQGPVPLTIDQVFSALFGDAPRNVAMVVNEWRLPRVLMALLIGAALGVRADRNAARAFLLYRTTTSAPAAITHHRDS
ncbi:iron chelate uptake ABC transporter family permease subunit, partial [Mycobacterium tuberculosis]|nr:iron chelate uptake ABC transporter family permease subunit [Mycobacterium tuberculosis]